MKVEEIRAEAREYADKKINLAVSMYNPAAETIAAQAYADGIKSGLKHHAHDYLVITKQRIEKVKENYKTRIEDLEKDKKYFSDSLDKQIEATLKLQQEYEELKEKLEKIRNYLANDIPHELINEATNKIWKMI